MNWDLNATRAFFGWCTVANFAILLLWWLAFSIRRDWIYRLHGRWFRLTEGQFDSIHYAAMAFFKLAVFLFNAVPWLVLTLMNR